MSGESIEVDAELWDATVAERDRLMAEMQADPESYPNLLRINREYASRCEAENAQLRADLARATNDANRHADTVLRQARDLKAMTAKRDALFEEATEKGRKLKAGEAKWEMLLEWAIDSADLSMNEEQEPGAYHTVVAMMRSLDAERGEGHETRTGTTFSRLRRDPSADCRSTGAAST